MTRRIIGRLDRLESMLPPAVSEDGLLVLSTPSIVTVAAAFAVDMARQGAYPDWYRASPDDRAARLRGERQRFSEALAANGDHHAALRVWLGDEGYATFGEALAADRAFLDSLRGADDAIGREWRRRFPGWRPGLSPAGRDVFEVQVLGPVWRRAMTRPGP